MRTIRLRVAYDGTGFHGWQAQPVARTVQGILEDVLRRVTGESDLKVAGAGRTDAGVHARGQVASFHTATGLPARAIAPLANRLLPGDVRVRDVEDAAADFHARHSAVARTYRYRLLRHEDLLAERYAWWPRRPVHADRLERATRALEGEADFSAFRAQGSGRTTPVCRVQSARWRAGDDEACFEITADHFLYHMVRNIVGTALQAADADDPQEAMRAVLASRDRARGGMTAPAHGLTLEHVAYPGEGA